MAIAIITAAGSGARTNIKTPKQFLRICGKELIIHTLEAISSNPSIDSICVVCLTDWIDYLNDIIIKNNIKKVKWITPGGKTGPRSIYNGLKAIQAKDDDCILIHDGNRPLVSNEVIDDAISVYSTYGNATASIPCVEITFESNDGLTADTFIDRNKVKRGQTPTVFSYGELMEAYRIGDEKGLLDNIGNTSELFYKLGKKVYFSKGSQFNFKITFPEDLELLEKLLSFKNSNSVTWGITF